jgi:hypothetical protein
MSFTLTLLGTAVLLIVVYIMFFSPSMQKKILATEVGPFNLSKTETVIPDEKVRPYYSGPEGTFSAYVFLGTANRTGSHAPCGTNPSQPCANGVYAPCQCDAATGDCSVCAHVGYASVFNVAGLVGLETLTAPDASRQGSAMAQLVVKTEGPPVTTSTAAQGPLQPATAGTQKYIETMVLPAIPLQKWTMITIAREGRRFDVYYNDRLVLSQKTMYMPVNSSSNSSFSGLVSGSAGLGGQIGLLNVFSTRYSTGDVSALFSGTSDTRGRPYLTTAQQDLYGLLPTASPAGFSTSLSTYLPSINLCPPGGCFNSPVIRPASPLYDWTTPYA